VSKRILRIARNCTATLRTRSLDNRPPWDGSPKPLFTAAVRHTMHEAARIILYGLLTTASPVTLLATLVVLGSGRGRANGAAFAAALVSGQAIAFSIAFFVGSALSEQGHGTASAYLEVAAGASCS
jgi:hypothetical protein